MLDNLVLVVHMDILSRISILQILYTMMPVFLIVVSTVVVVVPYTVDG